jgi:hypothetical protein
MSNTEQEHFYYVDPGIGEKGRGCPYTFHKDGHDIRSFIIPPLGYELTDFKLEPYPEDKFYDGKIVAQYKKIPFFSFIKRNFWKYFLTAFSFLAVFAVLAFFFTNRRPKLSTQHFNPNTEVTAIPSDTIAQEQVPDTSSKMAKGSNAEEPVEETITVEKVAEGEIKEMTPTNEIVVEQNVVEQNVKENETAQVSTAESEPEQESQPVVALTKEQFHQEFWDLIHRKERHMRTYHELYTKYKGLHLKTKEFYYLYLTILENTAAFEAWKAKLVLIPNDELQAINTVNALKQKIEEYE